MIVIVLIIGRPTIRSLEATLDYRKTNYKKLGSHPCNNALTTFDLTKRYNT